MTTAAEVKRLLSEIDRYLDAAKNTRESLLKVERRLKRIRELATEGLEVRDLLSRFPDASASAAKLADSQKALQEAQHRTRRQIVLLGRGEGLSLAQLASLWGISRALISRYANESAEETGQ